jgi:hypothetical protein
LSIPPSNVAEPKLLQTELHDLYFSSEILYHA